MAKIVQLFKVPENENAKIWRYLDFTKFVSMLDKKALFFSRLDKLEDPFEGSYPKTNVEQRPTFYKKYFNEQAEQILKLHKQGEAEIRKYILISCWHLNELETAAMWKLYLKKDEGIAVQSTYKRFKDCFSEEIEDNIYIGKVNYIDYHKEKIDEGNFFSRFFHKRKSFHCDNEFRALLLKLTKNSQKENSNRIIKITNPPYENGAYIPINLDILIENIYISPTAPKWISELVKSVVNKYGINKDVKRSDLFNDPVY